MATLCVEIDEPRISYWSQPSEELPYTQAFVGLKKALEELSDTHFIKSVSIAFPHGAKGSLRYTVVVVAGGQEITLVSQLPEDSDLYAPEPFTPEAIRRQFLSFLGRKLSREVYSRTFQLQPLQDLADQAKTTTLRAAQ